MNTESGLNRRAPRPTGQITTCTKVSITARRRSWRGRSPGAFWSSLFHARRTSSAPISSATASRLPTSASWASTARRLVRLVNASFDPTGLSDSELVSAAQQARETKKRVEIAAAAALAARGWSWRRIGRELGVDHSTAYGWVRDAGLLPSDAETAAD